MNKQSSPPSGLPDNKEASLSFPIAFAALFMGAIAMGISPVFVRNAEVEAFASAFWRVALALPILLAWAQLEARKRNERFYLFSGFSKIVLLTGVLFAADLFFWHLAIMNTNVANATLLACLAPVWVLLLSGKFTGEEITRQNVVGLLICLAGASLLIGTSYQLKPENVRGDIYGLVTSFFFGLYFLAVRVARRNHEAGALTFSSTIVTTIILFAVTVVSGQEFLPETLGGVGALAALGIISHSGGQGLLAVALGSLSAVFSSLVIFIEALAAAIFGWVLLDEELSAGQIGGGILILSGIWVARPSSD